MTILEEEARRRKALEMQAEMQGRYRVTITRPAPKGPESVTDTRKPSQPAAKGVRAGSEAARTGKKIADSSVAARAPKAGAPHAKDPDPEIPESRKTKPNRRENEFMLNLMILRNTLHRNAPETRERAKLAGKYVWRDIRLMTKLVDKIQDALLRTMPASRDEYYSAYARHGHYELHIDGPVRTSRHLLVTDKHLAAMAEAAMKSECILCMREGSEIGQCPLREALLETAAPTDLQPDGLIRKCEYRDAAGALIQGKDVTV